MALYLILLAFFIILSAVSTQAASRAAAAMDSVNRTFQNAGSNAVPDISPDAGDAAKDTVLNSVQRTFLSAMNIDGRYSCAGGNVFEVQFPDDYLFIKGSLRVRPDMSSFLDQLVAALRAAPDGNRQEMAILFGTGGGVAREVTRSQEIAIRRAGSLARYLRDQGVASGTFSSGFTAIPEGEVLAVFRSSLARDQKLDLGGQMTDADDMAEMAVDTTGGGQ